MDKRVKAYEVSFYDALARDHVPFGDYGYKKAFGDPDEAQKFADSVNIISTVRHLYITAEIKPIYEQEKTTKTRKLCV